MIAAEASDSLIIPLADADASMALGARLGAHAAIGDVFALFGDLGAGKTTLARGFVRAWTGTDEDAPSPTFTLVQTYEGPRGALWHMDWYRLRGPEEAEELDLEHGFAQAVCLIEWPQRLGAALPARRVEIHLAMAPVGRVATITGIGRPAPAWTMDVGNTDFGSTDLA